ncbi:MAG: phospholipid/cholesterol/gamma-HCH transport system substrate-binding protein [Pseudonocardiales bacterium]|nr:phospholipid/cholesterol/gamma-HCH transport system substrate-binding protein [Pseudonocardiales bacterium]
MTPRTSRGSAWFSTIAFLCVVALVVVAALAFVMNRPSGTKYSAMLSTVIGLYPGSDVRVLGVPVGRIDSVEPRGQLVKVNFEVNSRTKVPAGAMAAVVAPTVVADRYLQLTPVYTGGPTMAPGTVIPKERTASPAEFDDLLASAQKLSTSLGPQGVNSNGALSDALHTLALNLNGNGKQLNTTLDNTAQAINTLSASRDNLAGTVQNLASFTTNLKQNDGKVREFTHQFAQVSDYLADERQNLGETLKQLSETLGDVAKFVHDNRSEIRSNVDKLGEIVGTVNGERLALEQVLDTAGPGLDGLVNAYNGSSGTLDTRPDLLASLLCSVYNQLTTAPIVGPILTPLLATTLAPLLGAFLPGGFPAGCVTPPPSPALPAGTAAAASNLKLPTMPGLTAGKLPAAAPPGVAQQSSQSSNDSGGDSDTPSGPPSLGNLLGGGR